MTARTLPMSAVLTGLSAALDITEGHPRGHAARTCLIAMRLADALRLSPDESSDLFYATLLKDAGCSSNAARVFEMFGGPDEHATKRAVWLRDWRKLDQKVRYAFEWVEPEGDFLARVAQFIKLAAVGPRGERELFEIRCARSAAIARALGMSEATAQAVQSMDEHWDGGGHPAGLRGAGIPIAARIIGLAQVVEIFWGVAGPERALQMAAERRGRWFDPELVECLNQISSPALWASLEAADLNATVAAAEPEERVIEATEDRLDQIATGFAWVIDAKSSFTFEHSDRVAALAVDAAARLGFAPAELVRLRRAALLHDIGKLAVPNAILDKPGKLSDADWAIVKQHPAHTLNVLQQVPVFRDLAEDAANHHERLDGEGYFRGLTGAQLTPAAKVLAVADVADALMSARPYRGPLPVDEVIGLLVQGRGTQFWPDAVEAMAMSLAATPAA
ncbi:MAG TPA: HD domain-containing phosphohydrolase [Vicinamibacterales bacterium]|nr:HD domain-containing phosphohydrolase [Vicinamibacterales bacterium]